MIKFIIAVLVALSSTIAWGKTLHLDPERTIVIAGPVKGGVVQQADQLERLTRTNRNPVYLVINSPGGSIIAGLQFMKAMNIAQDRGVTLRCVVPLMAASMAYSIFSECDERYAFNHSLLLFHSAKVGGAFKTREIPAVYEDIRDLERALLDRLIAKMGMESRLFWRSFFAERMWTAEVLQSNCQKGFLTIITDLDGTGDLNWLDPGQL